MTQKRRFTAVGVFANRSQAETAIHELLQAGIAVDKIGVAVRDGTATDLAGSGPGTLAAETAATGAAAGGAFGALAGALTSGLIPGIGPLVAGGLLAAALGGSAVGAATGALVGALVGYGISEEEARFYDREFTAGRVVVAVEAPGRSAEVAGILRRCGAYHTTAVPEMGAISGEK